MLERPPRLHECTAVNRGQLSSCRRPRLTKYLDVSDHERRLSGEYTLPVLKAAPLARKMVSVHLPRPPVHMHVNLPASTCPHSSLCTHLPTLTCTVHVGPTLQFPLSWSFQVLPIFSQRWTPAPFP